MYEEIVKVDSKGRITIPATLRLVLGIEEGSKLLLVADPDSMKIEIKVVPQNVVIEKRVINENELVEFLSKHITMLYALSCHRISEHAFQCRLAISKHHPQFTNNTFKRLEKNGTSNGEKGSIYSRWNHINFSE